ncbi:porin family protein [Novosphingobium profundi]|uniref:outer membrane protein n=1 Tax=Novosphingobium profundi TaxID=1774954 RepID=UPI001BDAD294|nr:porin family protein [Novosphingobium profundi]MBT0667320.1 porin family protein [Novosphingobium profundi]
MKTFFAGLAAAASLFSVAPAFADTFAGPYVGAEAGWNEDRVRGADTDIGDMDLRDNRDAFVGGVYAGYNYKVTPQVVVGAEAGFDMGADDRLRGNGNTIDPNYSFDVAARAGYLVTPQTLLYVRGGYENMRARVSNGLVEGHDTFDGWSVGGGVERAITDHVSARLEYRYSDLGNNGNDFDRHQALFGVAYNF